MKIKDILLMAVATTAILTGCNNKESKVETTEFVDDVKAVSYTHLTLPTNREV